MRIESQILKFLLILCPTSVIFFPGMAAKRRFPQMAGHFPAEFLRRPLRYTVTACCRNGSFETPELFPAGRHVAVRRYGAAATARPVNAARI